MNKFIISILQYSRLWIPNLLKNPANIFYLIKWYNYKKITDSIKIEIPWIVFPAIKWMDSHITSDMTVFEWGSGGSTFYFAKKVNKLYSIENDAEWFGKIDRILKRNDYSNVTYILSEGIKVNSTNISSDNPYSYCSHSLKYQQTFFEKYVKIIDTFADNYFDLIFIDGRARPSCILHAINKLKKGGFLILDNSERNEYFKGIDLIKNCEMIEFYGPGPFIDYFWKTTIWIKN